MKTTMKNPAAPASANGVGIHQSCSAQTDRIYRNRRPTTTLALRAVTDETGAFVCLEVVR